MTDPSEATGHHILEAMLLDKMRAFPPPLTGCAHPAASVEIVPAHSVPGRAFWHCRSCKRYWDQNCDTFALILWQGWRRPANSRMGGWEKVEGAAADGKGAAYSLLMEISEVQRYTGERYEYAILLGDERPAMDKQTYRDKMMRPRR